MMRTHVQRAGTQAASRRSNITVLGILAAVATLAASLIVSVDVAAQSTTDDGVGDVNDDFEPSHLGGLFGPFEDRTGSFKNATNNPGVVNRNNPFFDASLGTNGQACVTCHQPNQGFSLLVPFIRDQFAETDGRDPLFRANDTADRPDANLSSREKRRDAFRLFLQLGVVRIGKTLPATADFSIVQQTTTRFGTLPSLTDPQAPGKATLSLFRRPVATTNTRFDSAVLWDGRQNIHNLRTQVKAAAATLLLGPNVTNDQADQVASFMTDVFTAQEVDNRAGRLDERGAKGGVDNLRDLVTSGQAPCVPMTDPSQAGTFVPPVTPASPGCTNPFQPFNLYTAWLNLPAGTEHRAARMAVARGEKLFNERVIFNVPPFQGTTCASCHSTTNVGNFPLLFPDGSSLFVRLGLDSPEALAVFAAQDPNIKKFVRRTADLPVYTLAGAGCPSASVFDPRTGQPIGGTAVHSTDPGRALVSGKCDDFGGFKPPTLRGLASRAPYFHNGAAPTLDDVVNFYNVIFGAGLTAQEHNDLVAFMRAL